MSRPRILVVAGSTRAESVHRKAARQAMGALQTAGADATLADLRDYPMPLYDGDLEAEQGPPDAAIALKNQARNAHGFLIASPEYNGSYPAVLKNAIDWVSRPAPGEPHLAAFRGKVAGILTVSPGPHGGARGLKQLRELLGMIGVDVVGQLGIPASGAAFDGEGRFARPDDIAALETLAHKIAGAARNAANSATA